MATGEGSWVVARNLVSESRGSIHDDERARELGFPGGLVGGNVQLVLVTSRIVDAFGPAWYERGVLRFTWVRPVYDSEEVRVVLDEREPTPVDERLTGFVLEKRDGTVVCAGFAALTGSPDAPVVPWQRADAPPPTPPGDYDPLPDPIGGAYEPVVFTPDVEDVTRSLAGGDPNPWYSRESPWGSAVVPTVSQVVLFGYGWPGTPREVARELRAGMNARIELVQSGPMFLGTEYTRTGVLVEKGTKGRHAFRTIEFQTHDPHGRLVNTFRWQIKWVTTRPAFRGPG